MPNKPLNTLLIELPVQQVSLKQAVYVSSALQFIADITLSCRHSWTPRHVWPCVIMAECVFLPFDSIVPGFFVVNGPPSSSECVSALFVLAENCYCPCITLSAVHSRERPASLSSS